MAEVKGRTFTCNDIPKKGFQFFQDMRSKKELCDVTFQVGNESISAHRIVIMSAIPYFRNLQSNDDAQREEREIYMQDIEPDAFKCLIEFAYCCEVKIDTENVKSLLAAACFLGVDEVQEECCDFLGEIVDQENMMNIREFALQLNCSELTKITDFYFCKHFNEISQTKDFLNWPLTRVKELISKDDLNVESEEQVFEATLNWVKYSCDDRSSDLPELLGVVRMPLLEPLYLTDIAESEELFRRSMPCRDLLDEARNYSLFPQRRKSVCSFPTEPRQSMKLSHANDINEKEGLYKLLTELKYTVQHFDLVKRKWSTRNSKIFCENTGSTAEMSNKMYFFVWGYTVEYDHVNNVYKHLSNVPTPRCHAGASRLKNKIYVCGGRIGWTASNVVESFDPEENKWTRVRDMRSCRWGLSIVTLGEHIFAVGGGAKFCARDTVERYDPETNRWRTMPSMLTKRCFAGAAALNGKIYVSGGSDISGKCFATAEVYDPIENRWRFLMPMNNARQYFTLLVCHGKLYALGGCDDKGNFVHNFEIYDAESNEWAVGPSTDRDHKTSGAVVM